MSREERLKETRIEVGKAMKAGDAVMDLIESELESLPTLRIKAMFLMDLANRVRYWVESEDDKLKNEARKSGLCRAQK